jgi:hypothetical protein
MNTSILLAAQAPGQGGGGMGILIMMVAIFAIMWFFMIRPQQKKQKEIRKFQNSVTVRDKGYTVGTYFYGDKIHPLKINFATYAKEGGKGVVPLADLQRMMIGMLYGSTKITNIKPDKVEFYFNYGLNKRVPVRLYGKVTAGQSYYLAHTRFWPDSVTIYTTPDLLKKINCIYTERVHITNFTDTVKSKVRLQKIRGVKIMPVWVRMALYPDILTEESLEVPIETINVPPGKVLRMFPSRVKVRFVIGASMFKSIRPEGFKVVVDYNDLVAHPSDKCTLNLRVVPHGVTKARTEVQQVDYLIEG